MISVTYAVVEENYCLGQESRTSYGIVAYANSVEEGTSTVIASVHDITADRNSLENLVSHCNRYQLSAIHLNDIVEDYFAV